MTVGLIMSVLDTTIALPRSREPLSGWMTERFGSKRIRLARQSSFARDLVGEYRTVLDRQITKANGAPM